MESEFEFTLNGRPRQASRQRVIEALCDVLPEPATPYMVVVEGTAYPLKQAFSETFGLDRRSFNTPVAQRIFERLGFEVTQGGEMEPRPRPSRPPKLPRPIYQPRKRDQSLVQEVLEIPDIILNWSYLWDWDEIANGTDDDDDIDLPPPEPGVYAVLGPPGGGCLYIGRASNLRRRVCYGIIAGTSPHPAGRKIRENEDVHTVRIKWAVTKRPAAAEEELHQRYLRLWGKLPKYVTHT